MKKITFSKNELREELQAITTGFAGFCFTGLGLAAQCLQEVPDADPASLPLGRKFAALYDFAIHGEWDVLGQLWRVGEIVPECLALVDLVEACNDRELLHFGLRDAPRCRLIASMANARLKLDEHHGVDHGLDDGCLLTIPELALATQMSEGYLRNATSRKEDRLPTVNRDGSVYVRPRDARAWLAARGQSLSNRYRDSVADDGGIVLDWADLKEALAKHAQLKGIRFDQVAAELGLEQEVPKCLGFSLEQWIEVAERIQVDPLWLAGSALGVEIENLQNRFEDLERRRDIVWRLRERRDGQGETIEVPVASDGSFFSPRLKRLRGYQIGAKGKEVYVDDFLEALGRLREMPTPHWRRPNVNGIPGIVAGIGWKSIPRQQLFSSSS